MVISLLSQERNLGLLTVTDLILDRLGKDNLAIFGWNYLNPDATEILTKINETKTTKSIIIKYIYPKIKFSNQVVVCPEELKDISDLIFQIPTYREELMPKVPLKFFKGEDNPMVEHIRKFYG